MNLRQVAILALIPFSALTMYAFIADGVNGFPNAITHDLSSLQIWVDLVIAMIFWCAWVLRDAAAAGRSGAPWVVGALIVGAFAPLLYMIVYQRWPASSAAKQLNGDQPGRRRAGGAIVLLLFGALTVIALATDGTDIPAVVTRTWSNLQIWVDLVIAIVIWLAWMLKDAKRAGRNPWGWVVFALLLGAFAPLVYLVMYGRWPASHPSERTE